jgi:hypothetical protein
MRVERKEKAYCICLFGCLFMRFYGTCLAADVYEYQTDVPHFCMHDFLFTISILKRSLYECTLREKLFHKIVQQKRPNDGC